MPENKNTSLVKFGEYTTEEAEKEEQQLKSGAGYMKLAIGRNIVRFLPPKLGRSSPFAIIHQHFIKMPGAQRAVVFACPRVMANRPCPACEKADEFNKSGSAADRARAGELWPGKRIVANVIDRANPDKGPLLLAYGKTVHDALTKIRKNAVAGGDFTHPVNGFDICITREGSGKEDTRYTVLAARNSTPLHQDVNVMQQWIDEQDDLTSITKVPSRDEILAMFGVTNGEPARDAAAASTKRSSSSVDDAIDAEFDGV